ncbi:MAG: hypothetical protein KIT31_41305, partial [Deltaproteobacteria bacterium]|nr:hypothetical protein [Deltaproteobacteria bacterium]
RVPRERWAELPAGLRPPGAAAPVTPDEPAPKTAWYCTTNGKGTDGTCARSADECGGAYQKLRAEDPTAAPCAPASAATCFSAYGPTTDPVTSCHPTIQSCSAHRDLAFVRGDSIGRECALAQ